MNYLAYTDGSYKPTSGYGGYAGFIVNTGDLIYGNAVNTTNNRMEIMGVLSILRTLPDNSSITIYSDSNYVVSSIAKRWIIKWNSNNWKVGRKVIKNQDLWQEILLHLNRLNDVILIWTKAHVGNPLNELCDEVADYIATHQD